ncbi:Hypothetical predicted protein [Paramuricea clavata]|uniref:Uncharacterized protein n=1 Tax=Paramuricea clavata TaxID=317549 RepID=A0A7D9DKN4_PARCT|nr:Hypothetical predicted protein [Paramuricea clavata]
MGVVPDQLKIARIERWWKELHERLEKYFKNQPRWLKDHGHYVPNSDIDRKSKKKPAANLSDENKRYLAATDKGSYFDQDKQWPELLSKNINNNNPNLSSSISRSRKKLETGKESFLKRKADELVSSKTESDVESYNSEDVSDDSGSEPAVESQTSQYELPKNGNFVVSVACLQQMLENAAVCKDCHSPLVLLEKTCSRQGLAAMWLYNCTNNACTSHLSRFPTPTSERTGHKLRMACSSDENIIEKYVDVDCPCVSEHCRHCRVCDMSITSRNFKQRFCQVCRIGMYNDSRVAKSMEFAEKKAAGGNQIMATGRVFFTNPLSYEYVHVDTCEVFTSHHDNVEAAAAEWLKRAVSALPTIPVINIED